MAVINLATLSSEVEIRGHQIMATGASVTIEGLSKVHEEIFTKI